MIDSLNTFSIIVDRFLEMNQFDINSIEYCSNESNHLVFKDQELAAKFRQYHKEKATLRIVRKECNLSRTGLARVKQMKADLKIK